MSTDHPDYANVLQDVQSTLRLPPNLWQPDFDDVSEPGKNPGLNAPEKLRRRLQTLRDHPGLSVDLSLRITDYRDQLAEFDDLTPEEQDVLASNLREFINHVETELNITTEASDA